MATTQHRPYVRAAARTRALGRTARACVSDWARACARESEEMGARARALLTCYLNKAPLPVDAHVPRKRVRDDSDRAC